MSERIGWLEEILHAEVPLTRHMGLVLEQEDDRKLAVRAELASNINIHGTAFGGSLFSICAIACWGVLHLSFKGAGLNNAQSVLGRAAIDYVRPVRGNFVASCELPADGSFETFLERLDQGRKAALELTAEIREKDQVAARFQGTYSAFFHRQ